MKSKLNQFKSVVKRFWSHRRNRLYTAGGLVVIIGVVLAVWLWSAHALGQPTVVTQEINLVDCPGSGTVAQACTGTTTTDAPTNGALGISTYDPTLYNSSNQVYFEVVMTSSVATSTATATLYDQTSGAAVTNAALSTTSTTATKVTSTDISSYITPGDGYTVRLKNSSGTTTLIAARLVTRQTFQSGLLNQTATSIDMGNNTSTTSTTFADVTDFKVFKYDASKYDGSLRFFLEATQFNSSRNTTSSLRLYDITAATDVPMTAGTAGGATAASNALSFKGVTPSMLRSELTAGLVDGHEYKLQLLASSATAGRLSLARIIIDQRPAFDQVSTPWTGSDNIDGGTTNNRRAQSFTLASSGYVYGFALALGKTGTAHTDLLKVTLRDSLDGNILGDTFYVSPAKLTTSGTQNMSPMGFYFDKPIWLTSGTTYYIQAERTGAADTTNYYYIQDSTANPYANGAQYLYGTSWGAATATDSIFAVYRQLPTKFETYQQQIASLQTNATATYTAVGYLNGVDRSNNWSNAIPSFAYEATIKTSAGTGYANMRDITASADIAGSEVTTTSTSYVRVRSGDITSNMPTSADTLDTQLKNSATNTTSVSSSRLVIDAVVGPTISIISPSTGPLAAGTPLTLYGTGFRPGATVTIGGTAATKVQVISSGQINLSAPAGSAGTADVVVTNTDGTTETYAKSYTYASERYAVTKSAASDFSAGTASSTETVGIKLDQSNWQWTNWTASTAGGSIAAGTYYYRVSALDSAGNETLPGPESTAITTTGTTSSISLGWRPVPAAYQYKIYRTTSSGSYATPSLIATLTAAQSSSAQSTITYTDTAAAASTGAPAISNGTTGGIGLSYGTVPSSGQGTFTAGPNATTNLASGAMSLERPDGKFLIIAGGGTASTIYDPVANSFAAGPTVSGTVGTAACAMQRPDGKFLVILGNASTATSIYDPVANTFAAGPALTAANGPGLQLLQRPDGKSIIIIGNNSTTTNIYDPVANTMTAGPTTTAAVGASASSFSLRRPDGKFLVIIGSGATTTNIYDPSANTFTAGPVLTSAPGAGAIQRPNGTFLIIGTSTSSIIYDPITNTMAAGPTTPGNMSSPWLVSRPDGKFFTTQTAAGTSTIYDPVANTFASGPTTPTMWGNSFALQRPDGKFLLLTAGGTATTEIYDVGWNAGTSAQNGTTGTFTSEALSPSAISTWNNLSWQQTADVDISKAEVRTATTSSGLASATYRTVSNGGDITPGSGEIWLQYRLTYTRTIPPVASYSGNLNNISTGNSYGFAAVANPLPNAPSITATYSKLQITSIAPASGPTGGGTPFTITGTGFTAGATVKIGGASATNVYVVSSNTITGTSPSGSAGAQDVVVTLTNGLTATLTGGYTYNSNTQTIKNTAAAYTTSGSSFTNVSTAGIDLSSGVFQWLDSTPSTTGGSLAAGTYYYGVTATDAAGGETTLGVESRAVTTTGTTSSVSLSWRTVPGAAGYKIYRTTSSGTYGASSLLATVSKTDSLSNTVSYTDTAAATSSGQPPVSNTTTSVMTLNRGTVPSSGAGTLSAGPTFSMNTSSAGLAIQLPNNNYMLINGTTTSIYDPVANKFSSGISIPAGTGYGASSILLPNGNFLILSGNNNTVSYIYNPVTNSLTPGPAPLNQVGNGTMILRRPDGRYIVFCSGGTSIYDPESNSFVGGPSPLNTVSTGDFLISRPDGKFLVGMGFQTNQTNIYDPVANTFTAGPTLPNVIYQGSKVIQRPNGTFLIISGNNTATTQTYDPIAGTVTSGPNLTGIVGFGSMVLQRPDGQFLVALGAGSNATNIYDPVTNTFTAGPALAGTATSGSFELQRPDGKYLIFESGTTTEIYDAGWNVGTTAQNGSVGTYISEDLNTTGTWSVASWVKTAEQSIQTSAGTVDSIEVKTATTQAGLASSIYREITNGGAINPGAGEVWLKIKITFCRPLSLWSRPDYSGAQVWSPPGQTVENRPFYTPTLQSLTVQTMPAVSAPTPSVLAQYHSDGATAIAVGGATSEDKTILSGTMTSTNSTDSLTLQVEVEDINTAFTGTPNYTSSAVPCSGGTCASGVTGTVTITDRAPGSYHWQARTGTSAWVAFPINSPNSDTIPAATDFQIIGTASLMRGGKTFINGALQPSCATLYCK